MEQLILEVQTYATACGISPSTVLQRAIGAGGAAWSKWTEQGSSCSLKTADRLRSWMHDNPPRSIPAANEDAA